MLKKEQNWECPAPVLPVMAFTVGTLLYAMHVYTETCLYGMELSPRQPQAFLSCSPQWSQTRKTELARVLGAVPSSKDVGATPCLPVVPPLLFYRSNPKIFDQN